MSGTTTINTNPEWPNATTLRSIAKSIERLFPDAADTLRGIALNPGTHCDAD